MRGAPVILGSTKGPDRPSVRPGGIALLGIAFATATGLGIAAWGPSLGFACGVGVLLVYVFLRLCGLRATLLLASLLGLSPSAFGESSLALSALCTTVLLTIVLSSPSDRHVTTTVRIVVFAVHACVGLGLVAVARSFTPIAGLYLVLGLASAAMVVRQALLTRLLKAVALFVVTLTCSYFFSLLAGFNTQLGQVVFPSGRHIDIYAPFTLTTGGTTLLGTPRFVLGVGEPGLNAFYVIPAFIYFASVSDRRARFTGCLAVACAVLFSQSAGLIIAFIVAMAFNLIYAAVQRRKFVRAILLATLGALALPSVLAALFDYRVLNGGGSITDRGLFNAGGATSASLGNINLVVALQNNIVLGLLLILALAFLVPLAIRTALTGFAFTLFAITVVFLQPSQWQLGGWLLLTVSLVWLAGSHKRPEPSTLSSRGRIDVTTSAALSRLARVSRKT